MSNQPTTPSPRAQRRKRALRETKAMFQSLFESAPDAVIVVDNDGRILRVNAQAEAMFGYSRDELLGQPVEALMPERFRDQHIMLSPVVVDGVSAVIAVVRDITERKHAEDTVRRQRDELAARARIISATLQTQDLDERLNIILDEAMILSGVEFGGIHLVQGDDVVLRVWRGISDEFRAQVMSFPVDQTPDWRKGPWVAHERLSEAGKIPDFAKREGMQAGACVPLTVKGSWLGVLMLGSRRYDALSEDDMRALQATAEQLALAIDHAHHCHEAERRLTRLSVLREIDRAIIVHQSIQDILNVVLQNIPQELGADAVAVGLLDEDRWSTRVFVMRLPNGTVIEEEVFSIADSLMHDYVVRKAPVIIYDLMQDPRVQMHRERIRHHRLISYLGMPLVALDKTIGILHLLTTRPKVFAEEDVDFFHTLAGQVAIAIENSRMFEEATQRAQALEQQFTRISLLNQITRAIAERHDLTNIFQTTLQRLEDYLPIDYGGVWLYEAHTHTLTVAARGPKSQPLAAELGVPEGTTIPVAQTTLQRCLQGETVYAPDLARVETPQAWRMARGGMRSAVAAPLIVEGKVLGILTVGRRAVDGFSSAECEFLRVLSEHVALAAHQARLREDLQKAYDDLRQTQQAVMQQERLRALGQMASGIAHDINNAISPVVGYAELLL